MLYPSTLGGASRQSQSRGCRRATPLPTLRSGQSAPGDPGAPGAGWPRAPIGSRRPVRDGVPCLPHAAVAAAAAALLPLMTGLHPLCCSAGFYFFLPPRRCCDGSQHGRQAFWPSGLLRPGLLARGMCERDSAMDESVDKAVVACPWREGRHVWVGGVGDIARYRCSAYRWGCWACGAAAAVLGGAWLRWARLAACCYVQRLQMPRRRRRQSCRWLDASGFCGCPCGRLHIHCGQQDRAVLSGGGGNSCAGGGGGGGGRGGCHGGSIRGLMRRNA